MKTLKHSRQRECIKHYLVGRTDHPTADTIYNSIRGEFPNISLGTVYRNLNLLVELGEIQKLTCGDGKDHFDWNTSPHYHFVCKTCGTVHDLSMAPVPDMEAQAQQCIQGRIDSHSIYFYGACAACLAKSGDMS